MGVNLSASTTAILKEPIKAMSNWRVEIKESVTVTFKVS